MKYRVNTSDVSHWLRMCLLCATLVHQDEMVEWHHPLNGHEFEQTLGDGEGQKPGILQSKDSQRVRYD